MSRPSRAGFLFMLLLVVSLAVPLAMTLAGSSWISPAGLFAPGFGDSPAGKIFWQIRIPRVLTGFLVGAALGVAGMVFQAIFRNSLATPFTLGVSSGASFGAALAVKAGLMFTFLGLSGVTLCAFGTAALAIFLIYFLTSLRREFSTEAMLLAGVAMSFFFSAAILVVQYLSDFAGSFQLVRWLMGNLDMVGYVRPLQLLVVVVPCLAVVWWFCPDLNLLLTGDELALTRGVHVRRTRYVMFFAVSLLTAAVVSFCGPIGFVGMMVPHMLRLLLGLDHRRLVWAVVFGGGAFLTACDGLARTVVAPVEIPVGIITALLGGPFFLWLLIRRREQRFFF